MESSTQQEMTLVACRTLIIFIWVSVFARPIFGELNAIFTLIGIFEGVIALVIYATARAGLLGRGAPVVVSLAMPLMSLPMILLSGGVNSPINFILPIFPFYATLMMGTRFSWIATLAICALIVPLGIFSDSIIDITESGTSGSATNARAYWIIIALLSAAAISTSFNKLTDNLSRALKEEANMDYLTRIANRRGLEKILDREVQNSRRHSSWLSLILLDIDNFKQFNDTHGHLSGDECLRKIADLLRNASRTTQDFVGRWGGEEFLIILPDTDPAMAKKFAELVRREINFMDYKNSDEDDIVTATLGCSSGRGDQADIQLLLNTADRALYVGKSKGKNCVVHGNVKTDKPTEGEAN